MCHYLLLVIFCYYKLFHPRLFLAILSNYNIWLLVILLLRLLVVINGYWYPFYWWLFYWWLLVVILLMSINGFLFMDNGAYYWLLY
jgi:hypothetical protein